MSFSAGEMIVHTHDEVLEIARKNKDEGMQTLVFVRLNAEFIDLAKLLIYGGVKVEALLPVDGIDDRQDTLAEFNAGGFDVLMVGSLNAIGWRVTDKVKDILWTGVVPQTIYLQGMNRRPRKKPDAG